MSTTQAPEATTSTKPDKQYGFSVLVSGFGHMFRGFLPFTVVAVVNAVIQALLIWSNPMAEWSPGFIALAVISFLVLLLAFSAMNGIALHTASKGRVKLAEGLSSTTKSLGNFTVWSVLLFALVMVGLIINPFISLLVLFIFPFLTLAAKDGKKNALGANFRTIGGHPFRWIITTVILGIAVIVGYLISAAFGFFISGVLGSLFTWAVWGVIAAWTLSSLAALYRSGRAGAPDDEVEGSAAPAEQLPDASQADVPPTQADVPPATA